jgi:hypothetical protein
MHRAGPFGYNVQQEFEMPQYLLAHHVFVCVQDEHVVFLDVRNDRYFALESSRTAGLGQFVPGWPVPAPLSTVLAQHAFGAAAPLLAEQTDAAALSGVISLLLEKGILTMDGSHGKEANPTSSTPVHRDLAPDILEVRPRIGPGVTVRFVIALPRARLLLKHRTFEAVVERVRVRVERGSRAAVGVVSEPRLSQLIGMFATLRPFFFTSKDACLFDALALSEFLAGYQLYPRWVFAVQARPFAAHCWLQLGDAVLNDTADHVKRYTPIMVV